eukprot:COSAG01_NODE_3898_length_5568_cov_2.935272_3_plen_236_part_00
MAATATAPGQRGCQSAAALTPSAGAHGVAVVAAAARWWPGRATLRTAGNRARYQRHRQGQWVRHLGLCIYCCHTRLPAIVIIIIIIIIIIITIITLITLLLLLLPPSPPAPPRPSSRSLTDTGVARALLLQVHTSGLALDLEALDGAAHFGAQAALGEEAGGCGANANTTVVAAWHGAGGGWQALALWQRRQRHMLVLLPGAASRHRRAQLQSSAARRGAGAEDRPRPETTTLGV